MERAPGVLRDRVAQDGHASGLGVDLEIDEVGAEARPRALRVDPPHAADGPARLAGGLGEVFDDAADDLKRPGFAHFGGEGADGYRRAALDRYDELARIGALTPADEAARRTLWSA